MANNKKAHGLGKGMGSLLENFDFDLNGIAEKASELTGKENVKNESMVREISLDDISANTAQPRKGFDEDKLLELADSIKQQGVLQPIILEEIAPGKYLIIAGERRYRASKLAGLDKIPAIVKQFTDIAKLEVALIENIQRENLNAIEEAQAYHYLMQKSGMTQEQISSKVGKNRSTIANSLRLVYLSDQMKDDVISGVYSAGHARAILSLKNPADQILLREKIVNNELSVRDAEKQADLLNKGKKIVKKTKKTKSPEIQEVENKFLASLGTKVELKGTLKKGKLEIPFRNANELERIYKLLGNESLFED